MLATVKKAVKDRQKLSREKKLAIIEKDFRLYALNYFRIVDNNGDLIPFALNDQQLEFLEGMEKYNIILKGRQLGFTTMSLAYCLWMALTRPNTHYLILAHEGTTSKLLFEKLKALYYNMPHDKYDFPKIKRDNRDELYFGDDNMSRIVCLPAGDRKNISRGGNYQYILLSEFAFVNAQNQQDLLVSIEQSLAKNADSKIVIESTGCGQNYFSELCKTSEHGHSKYKFFFFPWFSSCIKKQFAYEIDLAWEHYKSKNKGRPLSSQDLDPAEKLLYEKHGVTLKLLAFRRYKLLDMSLSDFQQEYPSFPHEAFQSKAGNSIFDQQKIIDAINHAMPELPFSEYKDLMPSELQQYRKYLHVYHLPRPGMRMFAGVDTAAGVGGTGDYSSISIIDADGRQCVSFYSNTIPTYEFAQICDLLGKWYNYAMLVVERNGYGQSVLEHLRTRYQYLNLYKHKAFNSKGRRTNQLGFLTTNVSKQIAVSDFKEHFELGLVELNCKETLQQMQIFVHREGGGIGNVHGAKNFDDCVDAAILAIQGLKQDKYFVDI